MIVHGALALGGLLAGLIIARQQQNRIKSPIVRLGVSDALPFAQVVEHSGVVYLSGVTAQADGNPLSESDSVEEQTRRVLAVIDKRLALAGTDKSRVLQAQVWLKDIKRDFKGMNGAWSAWTGATAKPTRATVESNLATPAMLVEIQVMAAAR